MHMRKLIITICLTGSVFIILDSINIGHSLVLFLFVGLIPGTNIYLSPIDMMAAVATAMTVVILRITVWSKVRAFFFAPPAPVKNKRTTRRVAPQN